MAPRIVREPTSALVTTRHSTAAIANASRQIWISEARLRSVFSPVAAAVTAKRTVKVESQIATRTARGLTWELVRATIEVALVASVSTTADQPWFSSNEAST